MWVKVKLWGVRDMEMWVERTHVWGGDSWGTLTFILLEVICFSEWRNWEECSRINKSGVWGVQYFQMWVMERRLRPVGKEPIQRNKYTNVRWRVYDVLWGRRRVDRRKWMCRKWSAWEVWLQWRVQIEDRRGLNKKCCDGLGTWNNGWEATRRSWCSKPIFHIFKNIKLQMIAQLSKDK